MQGRFEDKPAPFTIHEKINGYEVLFINEGNFKDCIICPTKEDAEALANTRVFQHRFEYPQSYTDEADAAEIEKTLDALSRHRLRGVYVRHIEHLLDRVGGIGA